MVSGWRRRCPPLLALGLAGLGGLAAGLLWLARRLARKRLQNADPTKLLQEASPLSGLSAPVVASTETGENGCTAEPKDGESSGIQSVTRAAEVSTPAAGTATALQDSPVCQAVQSVGSTAAPQSEGAWAEAPDLRTGRASQSGCSTAEPQSEAAGADAPETSLQDSQTCQTSQSVCSTAEPQSEGAWAEAPDLRTGQASQSGCSTAEPQSEAAGADAPETSSQDSQTCQTSQSVCSTAEPQSEGAWAEAPDLRTGQASQNVCSTAEPKCEEVTPQSAPQAQGSIRPEQAVAQASPARASAKRAPKSGGMARGFLNKPAKKSKKVESADTDTPAQEPADHSKAKRPDDPGASGAAADAIAREQQVGVTAFHNCSFREAKASFERMRDIARTAGLGREEGQASRLLANALDKLDAPEAEIDAAYQAAMRSAHQHDDMELSFNVLTGMGSHAVKAGDLDVAEHLYQQSLMLAQRVLSVHEQGIAEGNLGMCLGQMEGRRAECLDHFRKAIRLQKGSKNPHAIVTLIANFASALCADGKYEEAQKEYESALVLTRSIGDRRVEVNILTNLANLCENVLSLPQKARQYRAALKGEYSKDTCAICLEPLDLEGRTQTVLQCSHIYHSECIDQILSSDSQSRSKCPLCRNSFFSFTAA